VSDDGIPSLSATGTFTVSVYPPPQLQGVGQDGNEFTFGWLSLPGQVYQLEYKDDLEIPVWMPLGSPFKGTGDYISVTQDLAGSRQRYFRLRVLPL